MTITLEVCEPRELLALVPFQLGFQPRESLVLVSLRGPDGRVGLVARADLDDVCDPVAGPAVAARLVDHLRSDGAATVLAVVYTDDALPAAVPDGSRPWVAAATVASAAEPPGVANVWVVGRAGYRRLDCDDGLCCPAQGRPLEDLESTQVGAHMVLAGATVRASRDQLADLAPVPEDDRRRARAAAVAWRRARSADGLRGPAHADWLERSLVAWHRAVEGSAAPAELGQVAAALDDVVLRDAVLVSLVPGSGRLPEKIVQEVGSPPQDTSTSDAVGRAVAALLDPAAGVRPDSETERGRSALERVVTHHDPRAAPGRTLLALVAWWHGDAALAAAHLDQVCGEQDYRLARLLRTALDAGMPPGWAAVPRLAGR